MMALYRDRSRPIQSVPAMLQVAVLMLSALLLFVSECSSHGVRPSFIPVFVYSTRHRAFYHLLHSRLAAARTAIHSTRA